MNLSVLKASFRKCLRRRRRCRSVVNRARAAADFLMQLWHPKCNDAMHLALPPSHCKPVHLSIPIHNNPVDLTLNYLRWCVLHTNLSYFCLTSNNLNPTGSIHLSSAWLITKAAMQLFPSSVDSTGLVSGSTIRGSVWGIWYTLQ